MSDVNEILRLANSCRRAFESLDLQGAPGNLPRFPVGCCFWATEFLAAYLRTHGIDSTHVCARERDGKGGHEWLEVDGIVVDVTLDQFGANLPKVHVGQRLPFHMGLVETGRVSAGDAIRELIDNRVLGEIYFEFERLMNETHS